MDLRGWGFPGLHLLEGEEIVAGLGHQQGLTTSAPRERALVLLTNRRIFSLGRDGRRWHAAVAALEEVEAVEMGSAGRNLTTLLIGGLGLGAGAVGWFLLPSTPALLPWVAVLLAGAGALLILLALAFPEEAALVLRVGNGQIRLEVSGRESARDIAALVDRLFVLREARRREGQEAPQPTGAPRSWDEAPREPPPSPSPEGQPPGAEAAGSPELQRFLDT